MIGIDRCPIGIAVGDPPTLTTGDVVYVAAVVTEDDPASPCVRVLIGGSPPPVTARVLVLRREDVYVPVNQVIEGVRHAQT